MTLLPKHTRDALPDQVEGPIDPGTGPSNLGKAAGQAWLDGDVGVQLLAVRNDAGVALEADGEYLPLTTDNTGALRVNVVSSSGGGNVTVVNGPGAAAVNIQDGGNSITVDDGGNSITVDDGGVPLQVAGTVAATQGTTPWAENLTQIAGNAVDTNSGLKSAGTLRVVLATDQPSLTNPQPVSGTVTANQGGAPWSTNETQLGGTAIDTNSGLKSPGTQRVVLATDQPQLTNPLKVDGSAVTQPVSGTVTANQGGAPWSTNETQLGGTAIDTNSGLKSAGTQRVVLATDQPQLTNPLKVDGSGVTQPISGSVTVSNAAGAAAVNIQDGGNSITVDGTVSLGAGAAAIGSVTVDNAAGAAAVNIQDGGNSITVDGTVALAAGSAAIGTVVAAGPVAHDGVATAVNPLLEGGYASAAAPTDVNADGDAVRAWNLRNGARATVLTAAGALIGGDAANGLDVDVTRVGGNVTVVQGTGSNLRTQVDNAAGASAVNIQDGGNSITVDGTVSLGAGAAAIGSVTVSNAAGASAVNIQDGGNSITVDGTVALGAGAAAIGSVTAAGPVAHDGVATAVNPLLEGGYASAAAPADVSNDGDAVRAWNLRNGARATVLTAAGALIGGDAANGLDVDVTRVGGNVTVVQGTGSNLRTQVDNAAGAAAVNIQDGGNSITVDGTVALGAGAAAIGSVTAAGPVAHDGVATAVNPLLEGGYASAAAPADVNADGDAVRAWNLRNGARATVLTAAGALIGGDAANGLDVDVTRVGGNVTVVQGTGSNLRTQVDNAAGASAVNIQDGGNSITVDGTVALGFGTANIGNVIAAGPVAHDAIGTGVLPLLEGGYASAAAPADVSNDGDAVRAWNLRNGARATVLTAAGALIGGDAANGLDVDVTRVSGTVSTNVAQWNGVAPTAATALADGLSQTPTVPFVGAHMIGRRADGSANSDPATLAKMFDLDTAAGTIENVLGIGLRTAASGGSVPCTAQDNAAPASGGFTDGTTGLAMAGYILDETAGTALSENDAAAARVDSKRAQVMVLEDLTTRGQRQAVTLDNAALIAPNFQSRADTFTATGNGATVTQTQNPVKYFGISVAQTGTVTSWDVRLEGSIDGTTFTTLITHTNVDGSGVSKWTTTPSACRYFRSRAAGLVLGAGTNVIATIVGMN